MIQGDHMQVDISLTDAITTDEVIALYQANAWSAADKPSR